MKVVVVNEWPELAQYRDAWSALLERSSCNELALSPPWLETWWQVFGGEDGRQLRTVLFFRGTRLVGMAPLMFRRVWYRGVLPLRRIEFLASGEREEDEICSDYLNIIAEDGLEPLVARAFVGALRRKELGEWDEVVLDSMNERAVMTMELVEKLGNAGYRMDLRERNPCPYTTLPGSWDEYLAQLSSTSRYRIRRTLRDLRKWAGDSVELNRAETPQELELGLQILIDLHNQRWQQEGQTGVFQSRKFLAFHRKVMAELLARDALDLVWLSCKGEPIAAIYNIVWNHKIYFYQAGRRMDLPKKVRPGIACHAYAIQHAISRGCNAYDFLSGLSRYKQQFSTGQNPLVRVRATRRHSVHALLYRQGKLGTRFLSRVKRRIRRTMTDSGSKPRS